jgi:hypothetical protein
MCAVLVGGAMCDLNNTTTGPIVAVLRYVNILCETVYGILLCDEYRNVLVQFHFCEKRFFPHHK